MAKGDIINNASSQAFETTYTFQPASGVEIIITAVGTASLGAYMRASITTGVIEWMPGTASTAGSSNVRFGVTNTSYLNLANYDGTTRTLGFSGVQVK